MEASDAKAPRELDTRNNPENLASDDRKRLILLRQHLVRRGFFAGVQLVQDPDSV